MSARGIPRNILIADNDRARAYKLAVLVNRFGYNAHVASGGPDFIRLLNGLIPNVVILAQSMPLVEGKNPLAYIRSHSFLDIVKVVTMSGKADTARLKETLKQKANAYMIWPVGPTNLFKLLDKLIEKSARTVPRMRVMIRASVITPKQRRELFATSLSEKGVFIHTTTPNPKGARVKLVLDLPGKRPFKVWGEVLYAVKSGKAKMIEPGMAVGFVKLPAQVRKGLRAFIEDFISSELDEDLSI